MGYRTKRVSPMRNSTRSENTRSWYTPLLLGTIVFVFFFVCTFLVCALFSVPAERGQTNHQTGPFRIKHEWSARFGPKWDSPHCKKCENTSLYSVFHSLEKWSKPGPICCEFRCFPLIFFHQTRCFFITHQSCETAHLNFHPFVSSLISACMCFCHSSVPAFRARAC